MHECTHQHACAFMPKHAHACACTHAHAHTEHHLTSIGSIASEPKPERPRDITPVTVAVTCRARSARALHTSHVTCPGPAIPKPRPPRPGSLRPELLRVMASQTRPASPTPPAPRPPPGPRHRGGPLPAERLSARRLARPPARHVRVTAHPPASESRPGPEGAMPCPRTRRASPLASGAERAGPDV